MWITSDYWPFSGGKVYFPMLVLLTGVCLEYEGLHTECFSLAVLFHIAIFLLLTTAITLKLSLKTHTQLYLNTLFIVLLVSG